MEEKKLIKEFDKEKEKEEGEVKRQKTILLVGIGLLCVVAGTLTGYFLSKKALLPKEMVKREVSQEEIKPGITVGLVDEASFKDSAEGKLEKGGTNGEGSHHLVREGGESQNVYLTSSVIDLEKFVGRKVKVWGQTFAAQKAGWLMDVGKLKVLE